MRSLLWILCSLPIMAEHGFQIAPQADVAAELNSRLPSLRKGTAQVAAAGA